jgi:8-oxo-dGTP diphosphatase
MKRMNVRVYGLLINDKNEVLTSHEKRNGFEMIKFPGGGLEFGEGTADCLKREWKEEWGVEIQTKKLFYLNDFVQASAFNPNDQVLSIYYLVELVDPTKKPSYTNVIQDSNIQETGVWVSLKDLNPKEFTFPIDQKVAELLGASIL